MVACVSNDGSVTGSSEYTGSVFLHCSGVTESCACIEPGTEACYLYDGGIAAQSCSNILGTYTSNLGAAIAFDLLATFSVFALSILTCVSVCCPGYGGGAVVVSSPGAPGAVGQQYATPQQAVYVQQQPVYVQNNQPQYAGGPVMVQVQPQYAGAPVMVQGQQQYAGAPVMVQVQPAAVQGVPMEKY
jgi:hypothetical protein